MPKLAKNDAPSNIPEDTIDREAAQVVPAAAEATRERTRRLPLADNRAMLTLALGATLGTVVGLLLMRYRSGAHRKGASSEPPSGAEPPADPAAYVDVGTLAFLDQQLGGMKAGTVAIRRYSADEWAEEMRNLAAAAQAQHAAA